MIGPLYTALQATGASKGGLGLCHVPIIIASDILDWITDFHVTFHINWLKTSKSADNRNAKNCFPADNWFNWRCVACIPV